MAAGRGLHVAGSGQFTQPAGGTEDETSWEWAGCAFGHGVAAGERRFTCGIVDEDSFTPVGDSVGFDFDEDGVLETDSDAI